MIVFIDTFFYNHSQQLTIDDCLRLAPFLPGLRVSSIVTDFILIYESVTSTNDFSFTNESRINFAFLPFQLWVEPNRDHHFQQFLHYCRVLPLLLKRVLISQQRFGFYKPYRCCGNVPSESLSNNGRLCCASLTAHFRHSGVMPQYKIYGCI
jgi:hypothetical protein